MKSTVKALKLETNAQVEFGLKCYKNIISLIYTP